MTYALSIHWARLWPQSSAVEVPTYLYALVDKGQLQPCPASLSRWISDTAHTRLFEGSFAEAALELSPVLMLLSSENEIALSEIQTLDKHCSALPIVSIIESILPLPDLTRHLQTLLRIEADGAQYLLRFADTQMLEAVLSSFTSEQSATFFAGIAHWWIVDHERRCIDVAPKERSSDLASLPLILSAEQTRKLLAAAELPIAASQMRAYDASFGRLSHAERMGFLRECRDLLSPDEAMTETALLSLAIRRWQEDSRVQGETQTHDSL